MKRCPKCLRFGFERSVFGGAYEECLWKDCNWVNRDEIDTERYLANHFKIHGYPNSTDWVKEKKLNSIDKMFKKILKKIAKTTNGNKNVLI